MSWLTETFAVIMPASAKGVSAAGRQAMLTRPRGFRGVLKDLGARLCDMCGEWSPPMAEPVVMAAGISDKD